MSEITVTTILADVDASPQDQGMKSAMRNEAIIDLKLGQMMKPIEEKRAAGWAMTISEVFQICAPIYNDPARGEGFNESCIVLVQDRVNQYVQELTGAGVHIELNNKGGIKTPKLFGQYITNIMRVLKYDVGGEFLATDGDGEYLYTGKTACEKLGTRLEREHEAREAEARRKKANETREKLIAEGKLTDITSGKEQPKQEQPNAQPATPETTEQPTVTATEGDELVGMAIAELLATIEKWSSTSGEMPTTQKGVTVNDHIIGEITKLTGKLDRYFTDTCHLKLTDALNKAAAA